MTATFAELDSATCSIARATGLLGDRWSILVVRDVLNGVRRFDALADHLGVSRDVLRRRLAALVDAGVLERVEYREDGQRPRAEYRLTDAGLELVPVLVAFLDWGDRHLPGADGPPAVVRHECGAPVRSRLVCADGHVVEDARETRLEPGPGARQR